MHFPNMFNFIKIYTQNYLIYFLICQTHFTNTFSFKCRVNKLKALKGHLGEAIIGGVVCNYQGIWLCGAEIRLYISGILHYLVFQLIETLSLS